MTARSGAIVGGLFGAPFLFARHGVTAWSTQKLVMGQRDIPLSAEGESQAMALAESLARAGAGFIIASPLIRTRRTAEIVAARLGLAVDLLDGLQERHWGEYEGRPRAERPPKVDPAQGETWVAFRDRTLRALGSIVIDGTTGIPVIVAHNGTWAAIAEALALDRKSDQLVYARAVCVAPLGSGWTAAFADEEMTSS